MLRLPCIKLWIRGHKTVIVGNTEDLLYIIAYGRCSMSAYRVVQWKVSPSMQNSPQFRYILWTVRETDMRRPCILLPPYQRPGCCLTITSFIWLIHFSHASAACFLTDVVTRKPDYANRMKLLWQFTLSIDSLMVEFVCISTLCLRKRPMHLLLASTFTKVNRFS